jgi:DNA-nicking Smr family endonuclease
MMQVRVKENSEDIGKCGCGRSPSGYCIGWHGLTEEQYQQKLAEFIAEKEGE